MKALKHIWLLFVLITGMAKAQIPVNDAAWVLDPINSEEFSTFPDTVNKWYPRTAWGSNVVGAAEVLRPQNLSVVDSVFIIKIDTLNMGPIWINPSPNYIPPWGGGHYYHYSGGMLYSRASAYQYGYLEIYAKFPSLDAYWGGYWLFDSGCDSIGIHWYNEIDATENMAPESTDGHTMGTNWHIYDTVAHLCDPKDHAKTIGGGAVSGLPLLSGAFHKYGIEWQPGTMRWYFDDKLVRIVEDPNTPTHPMNAILNFGVDPDSVKVEWENVPKPPYHTFPAYFYVDYMRYYKLDTDCQNSLLISCPVVPANVRKVKKSISTNGSCFPVFNTSDEITLRAVNYILLNAGATANPDGTGYFSIITMPCPE